MHSNKNNVNYEARSSFYLQEFYLISDNQFDMYERSHFIWYLLILTQKS